ncbi:hypothetical protein NDU88_010709 [Pleurodeles waltl]|uniref:Uncharacterized protein n=1 Tax=Pleurodeles waltl TaxID=8319 RepID=A0AAV7Q319_PLEWA|nr:hypothetical protein NDU88_010709 [Pleurodeles waltl]
MVKQEPKRKNQPEISPLKREVRHREEQAGTSKRRGVSPWSGKHQEPKRAVERTLFEGRARPMERWRQKHCLRRARARRAEPVLRPE